MKQTLKMVYLSFNYWNELYNGSHVVELPKYRYTQTRTKENGAIVIRHYRYNRQTGESEEIQIRCKH